jgi:hypothetical protein
MSAVKLLSIDWQGGIRKAIVGLTQSQWNRSKYMAFMESQEMLATLAESQPRAEFVDFILNLLIGRNLEDTALFKFLFQYVESSILADPKEEWLLLIRLRLNTNVFDNTEIIDMMKDFSAKLPQKQTLAEPVPKAPVAPPQDLMATLKDKLKNSHQENISQSQAAFVETCKLLSQKFQTDLKHASSPEDVEKSRLEYQTALSSSEDKYKDKLQILESGFQQAILLLNNVSS